MRLLHHGIQLLGLTFIWQVESVCAHGPSHERLAELDRQIAKQPQVAELHSQKAWLLLTDEDWQAALVELEKADRLTGKKQESGWLRGQALAAGGHHAAAKAALDDFLTHFPNHSGARVSRARVKLKLEQSESALADYRSALELLPEAEADLVLEVVEALLTYHHEDEALKLLSAKLERLKNPPGLVLKMIEMETALGRYASALERLESVQKTAPRPEPWMARRASVLAQAGRISESMAAWRELTLHLHHLPEADRSSHAMQMLAEQAKTATKALRSLSPKQP